MANHYNPNNEKINCLVMSHPEKISDVQFLLEKEPPCVKNDISYINHLMALAIDSNNQPCLEYLLKNYFHRLPLDEKKIITAYQYALDKNYESIVKLMDQHYDTQRWKSIKILSR